MELNRSEGGRSTQKYQFFAVSTFKVSHCAPSGFGTGFCCGIVVTEATSSERTRPRTSADKAEKPFFGFRRKEIEFQRPPWGAF